MALPCPEPVLGQTLGSGKFGAVYRAHLGVQEVAAKAKHAVAEAELLIRCQHMLLEVMSGTQSLSDVWLCTGQLPAHHFKEACREARIESTELLLRIPGDV